MAQAASLISIASTAVPKRVLILGAGLAGLSAAFQLRQAGHNVTILEGQTRPGGRVQTLREAFTDGVHGEAGPVRIADTHNLTLHYVKLFGLPLEPFHTPGLDTLYYVKEKRLRLRSNRPAPDLPFPLRPDERPFPPTAFGNATSSPLPRELPQR